VGIGVGTGVASGIGVVSGVGLGADEGIAEGAGLSGRALGDGDAGESPASAAGFAEGAGLAEGAELAEGAVLGVAASTVGKGDAAVSPGGRSPTGVSSMKRGASGLVSAGTLSCAANREKAATRTMSARWILFKSNLRGILLSHSRPTPGRTLG
jgi:hypothetical protein